jgi:hypothetical protein
VQHLAAAVGPVAAPAAAAATLISTIAFATEQAHAPAVIASPVINEGGARWLAVLNPAAIGAHGSTTHLAIYEWQHERWSVVGLLGSLPAVADGTTYRISASPVSGTLAPAWALDATYAGVSAVGVVSDFGGTWHLVSVTTPGTSGLLKTVGGLAQTQR